MTLKLRTPPEKEKCCSTEKVEWAAKMFRTQLSNTVQIKPGDVFDCDECGGFWTAHKEWTTREISGIHWIKTENPDVEPLELVDTKSIISTEIDKREDSFESDRSWPRDGSTDPFTYNSKAVWPEKTVGRVRNPTAHEILVEEPF